MTHILFTRIFDILCNIFPSTMCVCAIMKILQIKEAVLDFNFTMLSNLCFGIGYF